VNLMLRLRASIAVEHLGVMNDPEQEFDDEGQPVERPSFDDVLDALFNADADAAIMGG
jgi:hypothetical protein